MRCEENLIGPLIFMIPAMNLDYRQKRQKRHSFDVFDALDASLDPSLLFANRPLAQSSPPTFLRFPNGTSVVLLPSEI
jgi:hypothetical protein